MSVATSQKPAVTVIIPTYNNARFLPESLDSVLDQSFRDFEIIVVDDGSTDDTSQAITPYLDRIRYIKKENGGPASARNLGIREARGEFIAFQDADDLWSPDKLELQIAYLKANPEYGVVFTGSSRFDNNGFVDSNIAEGNDVPTGMIFNQLLTRHFIAMSSVVVRRACIEEVGLFDASLIGAEDYNLFLRLARRYPFGFIKRVLVQKRDHQGNLSEDLHQMCHDEILNLHKIADMFPDEEIPKRKLTGQIYLRFGKYHFNKQEFSSARACFLNAIRRSPALAEAWLFFAVSTMPGRLRDQLLALRRKKKAVLERRAHV